MYLLLCHWSAILFVYLDFVIPDRVRHVSHQLSTLVIAEKQSKITFMFSKSTVSKQAVGTM